MKLFDKFKDVCSIMLICVIMAIIIIIYGTYRCNNTSFTDPFTKTIFPKSLKN
jgi:hypothetical protein